MTYQLLIGGMLVDGAGVMDVVDPATERVLAKSPRASRQQLDQAVASAKAAGPGWSSTPIEARRQTLHAIAGVLEANIADLARVLTEEQGKPIREATGEITNALAFFRHFASLDLAPRVLDDSPQRRVELHRVPQGVTALIVPWNFPIVLLAFKLPAALLAGNTVVIKPAPTTPLTTLRLAALVKDLVPPGVINVITDNNDLGDALTSHPDVRKVSFTGSTATGIKVMHSAADGLRRLTLELGGNDPAIVLDDVDPAKVATQLFWAAFRNAGQACNAIKRLYVQSAIYDRMCDELVAVANSVLVGNGLEPTTQIGPLQNRQQHERLRDLLDDARRTGRVIAGGEVPTGPGYFFPPTIVRDITDGARLVDEEQFGPVLPIIRFDDPIDAVARANASQYGLGASVWSADVERATALGSQLEAGTVWINTHMALGPNIPFAGTKSSGIGVELGDAGLAEFTQLKVIHLAKAQ